MPRKIEQSHWSNDPERMSEEVADLLYIVRLNPKNNDECILVTERKYDEITKAQGDEKYNFEARSIKNVRSEEDGTLTCDSEPIFGKSGKVSVKRVPVSDVVQEKFYSTKVDGFRKGDIYQLTKVS